ncbi:MAG: LacI family DNA-binding transcriptional regulator [Verrucomicrobiota bacterium]
MEKRKKGTVSLRDVAKTAKCSHTTVSLALRGDSSIPPATQKRILQIAHKMGYKRDPYATALMTLMRGKRPTGIRAEIGWIHAIQPDMGVHHPANINMLKGARARALELGYRLC